mmetsp:Transcript_56397/g.157167  ORF Transcript_56397/g.157167 Transcript_56397/m.157167 type:complete len:224 (+) Transcript_56397:403-1074(+)
MARSKQTNWSMTRVRSPWRGCTHPASRCTSGTRPRSQRQACHTRWPAGQRRGDVIQNHRRNARSTWTSLTKASTGRQCKMNTNRRRTVRALSSPSGRKGGHHDSAQRAPRDSAACHHLRNCACKRSKRPKFPTRNPQPRTLRTRKATPAPERRGTTHLAAFVVWKCSGFYASRQDRTFANMWTTLTTRRTHNRGRWALSNFALHKAWSRRGGRPSTRRPAPVA